MVTGLTFEDNPLLTSITHLWKKCS